VKAFASFDWPLIAWVAKRPVLRFAYFGKHDRLHFNNFSRKEERLPQVCMPAVWRKSWGCRRSKTRWTSRVALRHRYPPA
jgi:hypothetical protein